MQNTTVEIANGKEKGRAENGKSRPLVQSQ
jgi:hypothetical protein